ncbi:hypothetical protein NMG60_11007416 [Bertholletia excelsa]
MATMAGWELNGLKPKSGDEMMMGLFLSPKSGHDLLQNCDLPPPMKFFAVPDTTVASSLTRVQGEIGNEDQSEFVASGGGPEMGKLDLLKALRLSQTRAREAEKKAAALAKEKDCVLKAFLEDSSRLFAYRQWVRLLELQLARVERKKLKKGLVSEEEDGEDSGGTGMTWWMALAVCLGIAGVGLAFGCRQVF